MVFFGRRRDQPDKQFPELSANRADQMRQKLHEEFDARDYDFSLDGDSLHFSRRGSDDVMSLSVEDLVAAIARDEDPDSVSAWTRNFVKAATAVDFADNPNTQNTYRAVRMLLLRPDDANPGVDRAKVRDVAPDLASCLVFDTGEAVTPAEVATVTKLDDLATIERAALGNLRRELAEADLEINYQTAGPGEGSEEDEDHQLSVEPGCWVVTAAGPYLSGAPLVLEDFLATRMPDLPTDAGILFGVPLPNFMLLREVTSGEDLAGAMHMIATGSLSLVQHTGGPGSISPRVYLWYGGLIEAVSSVAEDGSYLIEPNSYLMGRLQG